MVGGATGGARQTQLEGGGGGGRTGVGARPVVSKVISDFGADDALNAAKATVKYVQLEFSKAFSTVYLQISTLLERVSSAFLAVGGGLAMLAKGLLSIKIETFKALIGAVESLSPALLVAAKGLGAFLALWGKFMELPLVQELAQISAGMKVLEMTGVTPLIMTGGTLFMLFKNWSKVIEFVVTQFNSLRTIIGGVIAYIGGLIAQLARAATAMLTAWSPSLKALQGLRTELLGVTTQLNNVAVSAQRAGTALSGAQQKVEGLKGGVVGMIAGFIKFQLIMFAITAAISLAMERFSAYKEAQDKIANDKRVQEAIRRLATTYKDLGENATESQKRAKAFEQSLVNQDYDKAIANVEKLKKKIEELRATFEKPTGFNATLVGKELNNLLAALNPSNLDVLFDFSKPIKDGFGNAVKDAEIEKLKAAQIEASKKAREVDKIAGEENVKLIANKQIDLSKEYAELKRQQQNDLFQQRQTLAQKEVDIFRAAGELRIFHMEQANAKLIEGEEGASRTALEALNNYLSVRENGELEIEAAKKDIAIEVANLEKTIADYRFENEKKIAEIKKRSAENEKAMADAQRQAAGQAPAGAGGGGAAEFGKTGNVSNAPGWVHGHFQTNTGTRDELISDVLPVLKELLAKGIPVELASGARVAAGKDDNYYRGMLKQAAQQHGHSGDGRSIDLFVPEKTKVPVPLTDISGNKGRGGVTGGLPGSGKSWVGHLTPDSKAGGAPGAAPAAAPTPALQSLDVLAPAAEAYAAAVRGVASAMERVRALQAALTQAQTVAAFEEIAKAAFPQVQLEGYEDNLFTVQATYDAVAASAAGAFDPERAAITIDRTMKIAAANREVKQITDEIAKRPNITEKERSKLADDLAAKKKNYLADLAKEEAAKLRILAVQRATDFITQTQADTKAIYDNIEVLELRNRLRFEGVDPAVIAGAEALLLNERRMVEATKLLNEQLAIEYAERDRLQKLKATADAAALPALQKDLDAALAKIAKLEGQRAGVQATGFAQAGAINAQTAAETEPGAKIRAFIGDAKRELADLDAVAVRVSQSIGDAVGNSLANGITGLIEGTTTAKEVFANFLKSIGQILVQEGTKMIAMYIAIAIAKAIAGMGSNFTGGNSSAVPTDAAGWSSSFNTKLPGLSGDIGRTPIGFANGGAFTNSIVSSPTMFKFADGGAMRTGLMGEAGPEAIMPLSRGADGSLGVQANGLREAMDRQQGGASGSPVLNMSFQSTSINGVEYVSRDQLESAMAETRRNATRDGAKRGMTMTLDRIQNSSSTRRKVGI
jgi:hypothetical protein